MDWLIKEIIAAVILSIIATGVLSTLIIRWRLAIERKNCGIKRIYRYGKSVRSQESTLRNSRVINVLGISANSFIASYRKILVDHVANGGILKILLATPDTDFITEASYMEKCIKDYELSELIRSSLGLINVIKEEAIDASNANNRACGNIIVRHYNTQLRNQGIFCIDNNNKKCAWLSVYTPPRLSAESILLEYDESDICFDYFDRIWEIANSEPSKSIALSR